MVSRSRSLHSEAVFEGVGVHSGRPSRLLVRPAEPGQGFRFIRTDVSGHPTIPVRPEVVDPAKCQRCTVLEKDGVRISTCEHILSALVGLGIWDADLLQDQEEVPFLDGSSSQFTAALWDASIENSDSTPRSITFERPFLHESGTARYLVLPGPVRRVTYFYESSQPLLKQQVAHWDGENYGQEIAPARTFGFLDEVGPLLAAGLARGASMANSVVFGRKHLLNNSLRFPDEPSRHKILDFLGDSAPLGGPLLGWIFCVRTGHRTNAEFVRAVHKALTDPHSGVARV